MTRASFTTPRFVAATTALILTAGFIATATAAEARSHHRHRHVTPHPAQRFFPVEEEAYAPARRVPIPYAYSFYPEEIEGGVSGNLPFNNQIRKSKDPLNANGAGG